MLVFSEVPVYFIPVFLFILLVAQILRRKSIVRGTGVFVFFFILSLVYVFGFYTVLTYLQYKAWITSPVTRGFLPPHTSYYYLFQFHFFRFALYHVIALVIAFIFWYAARRADRLAGGTYFDREELPIAASVIVLLGSPTFYYGWLLYLLLLFLSYFIVQLYHFIRWRYEDSQIRDAKAPRIPLYYFWVPTGLLVILIEYLLR